MAIHETRFEFADRGSTSVYKFSFPPDDPNYYVWFEYDGGSGALYQTYEPGPYRVDHPLEACEFQDLDSLIAARETTKKKWIEDLMAQFGEALAWAYP